MMPNHFQALVLFALAVSAAFALLSRRTTAARINYAVWAFIGFIAVAVGIGWLMYPFSR
jgi:hypothetical protein